MVQAVHVNLYVPSYLRDISGGERQLSLEASSLGEALRQIQERYPELGRRVLCPEGTVLRHVTIFVNNQAVDCDTVDAIALQEGDEIAMVPAMAGGSRSLSPDQVDRYRRHIIMPEVGGSGQRALLDSKVVLIGAGGLGSPAAMYLAAAGVGTLGIVDFDVVDKSNLQRQLLHDTNDVGRLKVDSAADRIHDLNPDVNVVAHAVALHSSNAFEILGQYDVIVNGCDNFPTRYLVNDAAVLLEKPLVDASIFRFEGMISTFVPGSGCYRCLYPAPPPPGAVPSCAEAGVLGVLPGIVGSLQAIETIKMLLGLGDPLIGRLLLIDTLSMEFREVKTRRDPECPVCGEHPTIKELIDYEAFCGAPAREESVVPA